MIIHIIIIIDALYMVFKSDDSPSYDQQQQSNYVVFRNDRSLVYTAFFADFGPLNLGHSSIMALHQHFSSIHYHKWHMASTSAYLPTYLLYLPSYIYAQSAFMTSFLHPYLPSLYSIDLSILQRSARSVEEGQGKGTGRVVQLQ